MSEWREYILSDLIHLIGGGTPKTSVPEYWNGDIPWLSVTDFNNGRKYVNNAEKSITQLGLEKSSTTILNKGDIIISARGTVGVVSVLGKKMAFNQSCYGVRAKDISFNDYIYYLLKYAIRNLKQISHGGVFDTITRDTFKEIEISLPPLPEQRAIAGVLSSLDDKIDLLHRQNKTLEGMAEALFRQWFVEEKEEGWEEKPLDQIADYLNGLACQKYPPKKEVEKLPVLKIKELRNGFTENSDWATTEVPKEYIVKNGDVVFSWSGSLLVKIWDGKNCILNQHLFKVTSDKYPKWFYYLWTKHHMDKFVSIAEGKATTMGHIKRGDLSSSIVSVPDATTLDEMNDVMSPIIDKMIINNQQLSKLEMLRDTLLPRLMSGEVRVEYVEKEPEPAETFVSRHIEESISPWPITKPFMEAVLFSGIVSAMSDDDFSPDRVRVTKTEYLAKRFMGMDVLGEYSKMTAGPYDPAIRYKGPEKIAKKNGYVEPVGSTKFKKGAKYQDAEKYIEKYGYKQTLEWVRSNFRYTKNKELELLATVDYAAMDLIRQGKDVCVESVVAYIKADEEWKEKLNSKSDMFNLKKVIWALGKLAEMFPRTYSKNLKGVELNG